MKNTNKLTNTDITLLQSIKDIFNNFLDTFDDEFKISVCEYLLAGNLFVHGKSVPNGFTYEEELKYDIENFNWDIIYPPHPSLCQLYLQGFETINYLIQGYEITSNEKYLNLASKLIKSWLEYEPNSKNEFTWYDHSVSDRVLIMIYFSLIIKKNGIYNYDQLINDINLSLKKHGDFLYDDDNYTPNNHGTMSDRSLYIISIYLNDDVSVKYQKKAIDRLQKWIKRSFSDEMVTLENSITYHLFNFNLFLTIEKQLFNRFGDSFGASFNQSSIEKCVDFLIYCSKPDLTFPVIGDSAKHSFNNIEKEAFYHYVKNYSYLEWLLTSGESGYKPQELFKVYEKEGYAFFRNSWDMKKQNDIVYASFRSGFSEKFHKHADDLSFTLFAKGKDIFVDAGTYTYEQGDTRRFFMSALAHNTVVVDNKNYPFLWGDNNDTGIIDYGKEKDYSYVTGKNDMYAGVNITRSLYYLKRGEIVIVDDIQSYTNHQYIQYYTLGSKITLDNIDVKFEDERTKVKISDEDININILQMGHCDVKFINGNKNKDKPGIISEGFGHLEETTSMSFSVNLKNARFITLITVNDATEKNEKQFYISQSNRKNPKKELILFEHGNEVIIPLKNHLREIKHSLIVKKGKNSFTFTITGTNVGESFAWYVLKGEEKIDVIWYSSDPVLRYTFAESGEYQIKYFIKKDEEKKECIYPKTIVISDEDLVKPKNTSLHTIFNKIKNGIKK